MMYTKRGDRVPAEAAALRAARHPGVVELVDANGDVLRTRMVDARPVSELAAMAAAEIAGLAAAVAATLADLHDLGVVHGGIDATHVLLTTTGSPVLCSLGRGGDPADDVAAVGHLATSLLSQAPPEQHGRRLGASRLGRRQLGPMLAPVAGPTLLALAAEAVAPDPAARPTMRALADAIRLHIPAARLPLSRPAGGNGSVSAMARRLKRPDLDRPSPPVASLHSGRSAWSDGDLPEAKPLGPDVTRGAATRQRAVLTALGGGVLGLIAVGAVMGGVTVAGGMALSRNQGPGHTGPGQAKDTTTSKHSAPATPQMPKPASTTAVTNAGAEPVRRKVSTASREVAPTVTAPLAAQVWPVEPPELKDGVLTFRGSRYAVGHSGDAVVAGDWACTGEPSLALLRRNTGQVFVFDEWPHEEEQVVTARRLARVIGATGLRVRDGEGAGCHALEVERQGAPPVQLHVRAKS